jgi:predicted amidohydrolase
VLEAVRRLAADNGIAIFCGFIQKQKTGLAGGYSASGSRFGEEDFLNGVVLFDSTGQRLSTYHKIHTGTWDSEFAFRRGGSLPPVFEFHGLKMALVVCYDCYFPELFR